MPPIVAGCLIRATFLPTSISPGNACLTITKAFGRFRGITGAAMHHFLRANAA
jgi:hypothetical protein